MGSAGSSSAGIVRLIRVFVGQQSVLSETETAGHAAWRTTPAAPSRDTPFAKHHYTVFGRSSQLLVRHQRALQVPHCQWLTVPGLVLASGRCSGEFAATTTAIDCFEKDRQETRRGVNFSRELLLEFARRLRKKLGNVSARLRQIVVEKLAIATGPVGKELAPQIGRHRLLHVVGAISRNKNKHPITVAINARISITVYTLRSCFIAAPVRD